MEKKDVIAFFDRCAPSWDAEMIKSDRIIGNILDNAETLGIMLLYTRCMKRTIHAFRAVIK